MLRLTQSLLTVGRGEISLALSAQPGARAVPANGFRILPRERMAVLADRFQIDPPVASTDGSCRPTDIPRFIVPVVLNAVQNQLLRGAVTNGRKKSCEVVTPLIANPNTSATVMFPGRVLWVRAAVDDVHEDHIFVHPVHLGTVAMRSQRSGRDFAAQASTGKCRMRPAEIRSDANHDLAAGATTFKGATNSTGVVDSRLANHGQPADRGSWLNLDSSHGASLYHRCN